MSKHWSEYWKLGHLTSFGADFQGNYTGLLKVRWSNVFSCLPSEFNVLDVATGNGALPLLVQDYFSQSDIKGVVKGIDYADINTLPLADSHYNKNIRIELIGNTPAEKLPFRNGEFNAVISQFGIEYSNLELSLAEVERVLAPDGLFHGIMHHRESVIIKYNHKLLDFILREELDKVIERLNCLATDMGVVLDKQDLARIKSCEKCEESRLEINGLLSKLATCDEQSLRESEFLNYVNNFFKSGLYWDVDKKLEYLDFVGVQLRVYRTRLTELVAASMSAERISTLKENLQQRNIKKFEASEIRDDNNNVLAWYVFFQK